MSDGCDSVALNAGHGRVTRHLGVTLERAGSSRRPQNVRNHTRCRNAADERRAQATRTHAASSPIVDLMPRSAANDAICRAEAGAIDRMARIFTGPPFGLLGSAIRFFRARPCSV